MDTVNLRLAIDQAVSHERQTGLLKQHLLHRIDRLHRAIRLPDRNAVATLESFVLGYAKHVPDFLDALISIGLNTRCSEFTDPLVAVSLEFFAQPPKLLNGHAGLLALMDEAYLAHRLIEEINSHFMVQCGEPLVPMDMTRSNLIVHHLIGEPFANQLDDAVRLLVGRLESEQLHGDDGCFNPSWSREVYWGMESSHWPCFTDSLSINLLFGANGGQNRLH